MPPQKKKPEKTGVRPDPTPPSTKLGPVFKYGEKSVPITIRIPLSVYGAIPEPKRDTIQKEIIKIYKKE